MWDDLDDDRSTNSEYENLNSNHTDGRNGKRPAEDATGTASTALDEEAIQKAYQAQQKRRKTSAQWAIEQVQAVDAWLPRIPVSFQSRLTPLAVTLLASPANPTASAAAAYSRTLIQAYLDLCRDVVGTSVHSLDALHQMQAMGAKASCKQALQHLRHVSCRDPYLESVLGVERAQRLLQQHEMHETTAGATAGATSATDTAAPAEPLEREREATFEETTHATSIATSTTETAPVLPPPVLDDAQWEQEVSRQVAAELAAKRRPAPRRIMESDDEDEVEFTDDFNAETEPTNEESPTTLSNETSPTTAAKVDDATNNVDTESTAREDTSSDSNAQVDETGSGSEQAKEADSDTGQAESSTDAITTDRTDADHVTPTSETVNDEAASADVDSATVHSDTE